LYILWLSIKTTPSLIRSTPRKHSWTNSFLGVHKRPRGQPHHFANDTTTETSIAKVEGPREPHNEHQADFEGIEAWVDAWLVSFNASKTKELPISKAAQYEGSS